MKLKITWKYVWYENQVVRMCFINGYPYTFEDLSTEECTDKKVAKEANANVMEQAHPEHFDLQDQIENPRELPLD